MVLRCYIASKREAEFEGVILPIEPFAAWKAPGFGSFSDAGARFRVSSFKFMSFGCRSMVYYTSNQKNRMESMPSY